MKIVVINGTEVKGCTHRMKEMFLDTLGGGHEMQEWYLPRDCPVFCSGCKVCFTKDIHACPHGEYTIPIWESISQADLIVLTSPTYLLNLTAQLKALLDHYGSKWMAHTPEKCMFSKQGVIITNAAGQGTREVAKTLLNNMNFWGVARTHVIQQALFETNWDMITQTRKEAIQKQCEKVCKKIKKKGERVTPRLKVKALFFLMRMVHKSIIYTSQKNLGNPETRDYLYWKSNGWFEGVSPWDSKKK